MHRVQSTHAVSRSSRQCSELCVTSPIVGGCAVGSPLFSPARFGCRFLTLTYYSQTVTPVNTHQHTHTHSPISPHPFPLPIAPTNRVSPLGQPGHHGECERRGCEAGEIRQEAKVHERDGVGSRGGLWLCICSLRRDASSVEQQHRGPERRPTLAPHSTTRICGGWRSSGPPRAGSGCNVGRGEARCSRRIHLVVSFSECSRAIRGADSVANNKRWRWGSRHRRRKSHDCRWPDVYSGRER